MSQYSVKPSLALFSLLFFLCLSRPAFAENPIRDTVTILTGASQIAGGALALPTEILKGTVSSFPFGIITGTIRGTAKTLKGVLGGSFNVVRGAAPYAKYAALL